MRTSATKRRYQTTAEGLKDLHTRLESLYAHRRRLTEELRDMVSQNDVSNVMYDYAQTVSHSHVNEIEHQINDLERIVSGAMIIRPPANKVGIGSRVTLKIDGKLRTYTIVGHMEADPLNFKISDESPFGKAMIGKKPGETFELAPRVGKTLSAVIVDIDV